MSYSISPPSMEDFVKNMEAPQEENMGICSLMFIVRGEIQLPREKIRG